jgi:hypothetical protein
MTTDNNEKTAATLRDILENWAVQKSMIEDRVEIPQLNETQWNSILKHKPSVPAEAKPSIAAAIGMFRKGVLDEIDYKQELKGDKRRREKAKEIMRAKTFTKLKSLVKQFAEIERGWFEYGIDPISDTPVLKPRTAGKRFLLQLEMMEAYFHDAASEEAEGAGRQRELALVCLISDLDGLVGLSLEKNDTDFVRAVVAVVDPDLADTLTHNAIKKKIWDVQGAGG